MNTSLRIAISSVLGIAAFAVLLFVPAGTLNYWQGWAFLAVFSAASLVPTVFLGRKYPDAFERRTHAGPQAENLATCQKDSIADESSEPGSAASMARG